MATDIYQEKINSYIDGLNTTKEKIQALKSRINPTSTRTELKEILDSIIVEDTDYVRRYLKNSGLIVFQKDFIIDNVNKWTYKGSFNNDSEYLYLIDTTVLVSFQDYALYSENYGYYTDVFINGVKVNENKYIIRDSYVEHETFFSGHKRLFIRKNELHNGDILSVVVHKYRNFESYCKAFKITKSNITADKRQYTFYKKDVGDFLNRTENLIVYIKDPVVNQFRLLDKNHYSISVVGDQLDLNLLEDESLVLNTVYLVMNKIQCIQYVFDNTFNVTLEEYIERFPVLNIDFVDKNHMVDGAYLPIPVDNIDEVEIFVNGYRLINGYDFTLINTNLAKGQHLHLAGILALNAHVVMRNKNISDEFGFYRQFKDMHAIGILDLTDTNIPISEDYVEAYVCRKRVPLCNKRSIFNRYLKIDNQKSLQYIDTFPEIEYSMLSAEVLTDFRNDTNKDIIGQIIDVFNGDVIDEWLDNNEEKPNEGYVQPSTTEKEAFVGHVKSIKINVDSSIVIEGRLPQIQVIGFYEENDGETSQIGMDITAYCEISTFDPFEVGRHIVSARYVQGDTILTDEMEVETVYKELISMRILTDSNFYVVGDAVKSTINVIAKFEDNSEKNVTDLCEITAPIEAEEAGYITIHVKFNYNGRVVEKEKYILVSETSERKIQGLDVILDNYIYNNNQISNMSLYATYTNNMIQKLDKNCIKVFIVNNDETLTEIEDIENAMFTTVSQAINLMVEVYVNSKKKDKVLFIDENGLTHTEFYTQIRIIEDTIESQNRYLVYNDLLCSLDSIYLETINPEFKQFRIKDINNDIISIGTAAVTDEIICTTIPDGLLIVDFLDDDGILLNQVLFRVKNKNSYRNIVNADISGSIVDGFTIKINKFIFGKNLDELNISNINVIDENYEILTKFNDPDFSRSTDVASEDDNYIYFTFNNFATKGGNVKIMGEFIDSVRESDSGHRMYLDILGCSSLIEVNMHEDLDIIIQQISLMDDCKIDRSQEDYYLIIDPKIPDEYCTELYITKPNNVRVEMENILNNNYKIKLPLQTDLSNSIYLTKNHFGINCYWYVNRNTNKVYSVTLNINEINNRVRLLSINRTPISETEYNTIPVVYA